MRIVTLVAVGASCCLLSFPSGGAPANDERTLCRAACGNEGGASCVEQRRRADVCIEECLRTHGESVRGKRKKSTLQSLVFC